MVYINPLQQKIHRRWVANIESFIAKKLNTEDEDLFMILKLYTSVVLCFGMKLITYGFV